MQNIQFQTKNNTQQEDHKSELSREESDNQNNLQQQTFKTNQTIEKHYHQANVVSSHHNDNDQQLNHSKDEQDIGRNQSHGLKQDYARDNKQDFEEQSPTKNQISNQTLNNQYLNNYPIPQSQQKQQQQKQSPSKTPPTINQQQPSLPFLRIIFDHYSKISYIKGPSMTFERVQHQTQVLSINKFMVWCKQFQITGKVPVMKLMQIFKKSGTSHKELDFDGFVTAINRLAEVMFEGDDRLEKMKKHLGVRDQNDFRYKCKELHISSTKPTVASVVLPIQRKQRSKSILKYETSEITESRMSRIKSQYLMNKALNQQKYPQTLKYKLRNKQDTNTSQKQIDSLLKLRQNNQKDLSQLKRSVAAPLKSQQPSRYSRVKSTVQKYKISTIISQAKIQLQKNSKNQKSSIDNKISRLAKKQESKPNVGLFDKLFGGDQNDEFLKDYQRTQSVANHKIVSQSLSKRIEQLRKISEKK